MKQKAVNFTRFPQSANIKPVRRGDADILDALEAESDMPIYNVKAVRLSTGQLLVQFGINYFRLFQKIGDEWFDLMAMSPGDPALEDLKPHMKDFGPSPHQVMQEERRQAARDLIEQEARDHMERRSKHHRERLGRAM